MKGKITGKAWKFGDDVDTDQIVPAKYLVTGNRDELAQHAFENVRPEFVSKVKEGDIIVADDNFGCGSSREHAPRALMGAGISCVVAKSFARIFFRNSINLGLPLVECGMKAKDGDDIEIDFTKGEVFNKTTDKKYAFKPLPSFLLELMRGGGLVEYTKKKLK